MGKTIAIDFDGVLNTYTGWKGEKELFELRPGAKEFLQALRGRGFHLAIYSTRDPAAIRQWLAQNDLDTLFYHVSQSKPMAQAYLDDRAVCFDGQFTPELVERLASFKTHWEKTA